MGNGSKCSGREYCNKALKNVSLKIFNNMHLGTTLGLVVAIGLLYFLLLGSAHTILSLSLLLDWITHLNADEQIIAVLLLPIYLGILVFGGGLLGAKIGEHIQRLFSNLVKPEPKYDISATSLKQKIFKRIED